MALKLRLKPHEKAVINGAVIENGSRAAEIIVRNFAHILREADVIQEDEADTPAKRCYLAAQLMLLDPGNAGEYLPVFERFRTDLRDALINPEMRQRMEDAAEAVDKGNYYGALRALKDVVAYEAPMLAPRSPQGPDDDQRGADGDGASD